jgi:hypothetical protein
MNFNSISNSLSFESELKQKFNIIRYMTIDRLDKLHFIQFILIYETFKNEKIFCFFRYGF